jgi:hypothetical protein
MPPRIIQVEGNSWEVSPSGSVTQYQRDEFSIQFRLLSGAPVVRVARYAPIGCRRPEDSLAELSEFQLRALFERSQPSWTAPETGYQR